MQLEGKGGITATVVQDSICRGIRLTTFELEYPRFIHAEFMTHRMLSKNAASSRAIPVDKMLQHVREHTAVPVFWGKNQPGMQAVQEIDNIQEALIAWKIARDDAIQSAINLHDRKGLHKQISNRVTEPFQMIKVVATGTEWANLLWLRDHDAAQPEFHELASLIAQAFSVSVPQVLLPGELHAPYVTRTVSKLGRVNYSSPGIPWLSKEEALTISASCCAQVSYRKSDDSLEKAVALCGRLMGSGDGRVHASPFEHQAWGMQQNNIASEETQYVLEEGQTHVTTNGDLWSGNFRGWIQHRQIIEGHAKW